MKNKKELIKIIVVIIIVIIAIIYYFYARSDEYEEIIENQIVLLDNVSNIEDNIENNKQEVSKIKVYIIGEINKPGVIEVEEGARLEDVIILAGGTTNSSDLSKVNLAYIVEDGEKIYIPSIYENSQESDEKLNNSDYIISENKKDEKVNINNADINDLCKLAGVGESLAKKIITYREANGKFKNIEDLKNVSGIGDKKYEGLKDYICIK